MNFVIEVGFNTSDLRAMPAEVTIITPVLNGAATIERCISSVAAQGVAVQHIVMDGGSTDGTVDILQKNSALLAHWESTPDRGQSHAINKGLALAEGRIFNWLNADDALEQGALQEVARLMQDGVDVVAGNCLKVGTDGKVISTGSTSVFPSIEKTIARYGMAQPSHFYRTETVKELGGLNEHLHLAMDMELWFRYLLRHGVGGVRATEAVLSRFEVGHDAKSQKLAEAMHAEHWGIMRAILIGAVLFPEIKRELEKFSVPEMVKFDVPAHLDMTMLLAHLCEGMLPLAYHDSDAALLKGLLDTVAKAGPLPLKDRLLWQLRLLKIRIGA